MGYEDKAIKTLKNCLNLKRSERLLILCDTGTIDIAQAFFNGASRITMSPILMEIPMGKFHGDEPPRVAAGVMIDSDVIVAPTTYSLTYTNATRSALANGARVATMPGITMEMLESGGLDANYISIGRKIRKFRKDFHRAKMVTLKSEMGCDLSLDIRGRDWITDDNGICVRKGSITNLPAGEVFIAPNEGRTNGRLVVDGVFTGKEEGPVEMLIRNGKVVSVEGSEDAREMLMRAECGRTLGKLGLGMNPRSRIIGNILEDQKTLGTANLGFGDNSTFGGTIVCDLHYDAMVKKPTVEIDGKPVLEDGCLVHKL